MSNLTVIDLPLDGLKRVQRQRLVDERGVFARLFCAGELADAGWTVPVAQINHSLTRARGTVRGLHYQRAPHAEMKLVSCVRGEVWDVAVDLRTDSPTFLQWHAQFLSAADGAAILIPPGFAHGFQTLSDEAELVYCHSAAYAPAAEAGLHARDARLAIPWPLPVQGLSPRDAGFAWLTPNFGGVTS
ncbi:dTDP-4-dehydrorhamnose 3,5-epimerase family protein [Methyloversatilis sp.]|uniref:dTDP-4-dehydrorhamnose 3,5-epimerase family protein n=1 Tax=Methyloversatilis sp. TaxID=2569862 RepID=UPI0027353B56|nr:dTDP-4-dehydrorhamnose 3,5-epimerase family protein [Methyloversatilis sp.]MDP3577808.1 dTDP-4-dehydrorhamnose 3,5-epimerase family protein [Methyloversatilis sp.]